MVLDLKLKIRTHLFTKKKVILNQLLYLNLIILTLHQDDQYKTKLNMFYMPVK